MSIIDELMAAIEACDGEDVQEIYRAFVNTGEVDSCPIPRGMLENEEDGVCLMHITENADEFDAVVLYSDRYRKLQGKMGLELLNLAIKSSFKKNESELQAKFKLMSPETPESENKAKFKLTPPETPESDVQHAVLRFLQLAPAVAWAHRFNSGSHTIKEVDSKGKIRKRFVRYAFPGCADILGQMKDGRFLAVEVKARRGRVTGDQQAFLDKVKENNGIGIVARSVDDVRNVLFNSEVE